MNSLRIYSVIKMECIGEMKHILHSMPRIKYSRASCKNVSTVTYVCCWKTFLLLPWLSSKFLSLFILFSLCQNSSQNLLNLFASHSNEFVEVSTIVRTYWSILKLATRINLLLQLNNLNFMKINKNKL